MNDLLYNFEDWCMSLKQRPLENVIMKFRTFGRIGREFVY